MPATIITPAAAATTPNPNWWVPSASAAAGGRKSFATLIAEGLRLANAPHLTPLAVDWLNNWLQKQYDAWPWPFLRNSVSFVLPAGTSELLFGNVSCTRDMVKRVLSPAYVFGGSAFGGGGGNRVLLAPVAGVDVSEEPGVSATTGVPTRARVMPSVGYVGTWSINLYPIPDRPLSMKVHYLATPPALSYAGGATGWGDYVPVYPNEESMSLAVQAFAANYTKSEETDGLMSMLAARALNDRVAYGAVDGINDELPLDGNVFR